MYRFDAAINSAEVVNIWRSADFSIPVAEVEALFAGQGRRPKLIFVTSPNNPDGSLLGDADLKQLLALPAVVVLDEAYIEFGGTSRITWIRDYPNLVVLRTFSKWAGLAGLRVGYGAFPAGLIEHLWKIKQPYNVNLAGQIAAQVSLADRKRLLDSVARLVEERDKLYESLQQFDWLKPYPSQANFILCQVRGRSALEVKSRLAEQGILVRYYHSKGLTDHIRISIGTPAQMTQLVKALKIL
jgi:histidinol-phosphate aminotransferase